MFLNLSHTQTNKHSALLYSACLHIVIVRLSVCVYVFFLYINFLSPLGFIHIHVHIVCLDDGLCALISFFFVSHKVVVSLSFRSLALSLLLSSLLIPLLLFHSFFFILLFFKSQLMSPTLLCVS